MTFCQLQVLINGLQHLAPQRLKSNLQVVETYIKVEYVPLVFAYIYILFQRWIVFDKLMCFFLYRHSICLRLSTCTGSEHIL